MCKKLASMAVVILAALQGMAFDASAQYKLTPDSVLCYGSDGLIKRRALYKYDTEGREIEISNYTIDRRSGSWCGTNREQVTYDAYGDVSSRSTFRWNQTKRNWINARIETFAYNDNGQQTSAESMKWNAQFGHWVGESKTENEYAPTGLMTKYITFAWDDNRSQWKTLWALEMTYDDNLGLKTSETRKVFRSGNWVNEHRTTFAYDAEGLLTESVSADWHKGEWVVNDSVRVSRTPMESNGVRIVTLSTYLDKKLGVWKPNERKTEESDEMGNVTLSRTETWNGTEWKLVSQTKDDIEYDSVKRIVKRTSFVWTEGQWIGKEMVERNYNEFNDLTLSKHYVWNAVINNWHGEQYNVMGYNEAGDMTLDEHFLWNEKENKWENQHKTFYVFDANHNKTEERSEAWNKRKGVWEEFFKARYEYEMNAEGYITTTAEFHEENGEWRLFQKMEYL